MRLLVLVVLFGFLTSHGIAAQQEKGKAKQMVITVDLSTGYIEVTDETRKIKATKASDKEAEKFWKSLPPHVGVIFFTHSSPGCGWVTIWGWPFYICSP